jgi:hypothetical protein
MQINKNKQKKLVKVFFLSALNSETVFYWQFFQMILCNERNEFKVICVTMMITLMMANKRLMVDTCVLAFVDLAGCETFLESFLVV